MNTIVAFGDDEKTCQFAEDIARFCLFKLMPRMKTLDVTINIDPDLEIYGYCLAVNKREFVIDIKEYVSAIVFS